MEDLASLDRRVLERLVRDRRVREEDVRAALERLPDLSGAVRVPDEEELARVREELLAEAERRREAIERALAAEREAEEPAESED